MFVHYHLEHKSQIDKEIRFFSDIAVAESGSERSEHSVVVIAERSSNFSVVVENILEFIGILSDSKAELHNVVLREMHLCLDLGCQKLVPGQFHMSHACKRHLLFCIMSEPLATNGVADEEWYVFPHWK